MQTLNLHVEDGMRVDVNSLTLGNPLGEVLLVSVFNLQQFLHDGVIVSKGAEFFQLVEVFHPLVATGKPRQQIG